MLATVRAGRRLNRAAGVIAASVLADSAVEHYRGSFHNKAMFTPLVVSRSVAGGERAWYRRQPAAGLIGCAICVYALAALTGLVGTGFHIYNVGKAPGGVCWQNLFYGAPLGAPVAMVLVGH